MWEKQKPNEQVEGSLVKVAQPCFAARGYCIRAIGGFPRFSLELHDWPLSWRGFSQATSAGTVSLAP